MSRQSINRETGIAPVVLSFMAFGIAIFSVATGWQRHLSDEGTAAHLFQLLIVLEVPPIFAFLLTSNWRHFRQVVSPMLFQAGALTLALGTVAYFKL